MPQTSPKIHKKLPAQARLAAFSRPGEAKKDARRAAEIAAANSFEAVARECAPGVGKTRV